MLSDKELKKKYINEFRKTPEKYYPVKTLKTLGFTRNSCRKCGRFFWSAEPRNLCGDASCLGGFGFINNPIAKKSIEYVDLWKKFSSVLEKHGYIPINRYPITARWRDDINFVEASIDDFIPYVINGEVEPPANPLIVPQICLRFNDIDNVGITGSHYTGFIMVGQHRFEKPKDYSINDYFSHLLDWFTIGLKMKAKDMVFHEDIWAGSGNFGPCVEFFSGGLELANQVYMQFYEKNLKCTDLNLKVLDMGLGYERNSWFSNPKSTSYENTFPDVVKKLRKATGIKPDKKTIQAFLPYSGLLNIDEIENVEGVWNSISKAAGINAEMLKKEVNLLAAMYSIAEHTRSLLFALSDGALPSNVGGGYNLRVILRRCLSFMDEYKWDIYLPELVSLHARYLKPLFPELSNNLEKIEEIINLETERYHSTKEKIKNIADSVLEKGADEGELMKLYDSHGVPPELVLERANELGKKVSIPEDFYAKVTALHSRPETKKEKQKLKLDLKETELLFYKDMDMKEFRARVLKIIDEKVIMDKTAFYPEGGGQEADHGFLDVSRVYDVQKSGGVVIHYVQNPKFKEGDTVKGRIDWSRREQLSKHHTSIHIINLSSRNVLGSHIFQAGSGKGEEKAHLDITHYKSITEEELDKIENKANEIVKNRIPVKTEWLSRTEAEKRYGMGIYQGGAVPGKNIRIVSIEGLEHEACGGLHLKNTGDAEKIIILNSERIQDGVVRITIKSSKAAEDYLNKMTETAKELRALAIAPPELPDNSFDIFRELKKASKVFNIGPEQYLPTISRFVNEITENQKELNRLEEKTGLQRTQSKPPKATTLEEFSEGIFELWKSQGKRIEALRKELAKKATKELLEKAKNNRIFDVIHAGRKELIEIANELLGQNQELTVILANESGDIIGMSKTQDISRIIQEICRKAGGSGGGKGELAQGKVELSKLLKVMQGL